MLEQQFALCWILRTHKSTERGSTSRARSNTERDLRDQPLTSPFFAPHNSPLELVLAGFPLRILDPCWRSVSLQPTLRYIQRYASQFQGIGKHSRLTSYTVPRVSDPPLKLGSLPALELLQLLEILNPLPWCFHRRLLTFLSFPQELFGRDLGSEPLRHISARTNDVPVPLPAHGSSPAERDPGPTCWTARLRRRYFVEARAKRQQRSSTVSRRRVSQRIQVGFEWVDVARLA